MRKPRLRFTLRRMMVAVAIAAIVLGFERWVLTEWEGFAERRDGVTDWVDVLIFWSGFNVGAAFLVGIILFVAAPVRRAGLR